MKNFKLHIINFKNKYNQYKIKNNYFLKLILLLILIFIFDNLKMITEKKNNELKVCLCTLGKDENRYAREFVQHYKNLNVDKIFIYDNNDLLGEKFEDVLNDYINSGFVEILNWRGKKKQILNIMNDCYLKNNMNYDWLIFYEFDEFIFLKDFTNIKSYLNDHRFDNCKKIQLNWIFHTDNNLLYYDNRSLSERFPEREIKARGKKKGGLSTIKSIVRGGIKNMKIKCIHRLSIDLKGCNGFGEEIELIGIETKKSDFEYYYIDHYYCKSTEEFIDKVNKGCPLYEKDRNYKLARIKTYLGYNKVTLEKVNMIEKFTGFNLSKYKQKI